jgi:hypothetical protein
MNTHPPQIPLGSFIKLAASPMWLIHQFGSLLNLGICKEYSYMARTKTPRNGDAGNKPLASTSQIALVPEVKKNSSSIDIEAEIRRRAYELFQERGGTPGHEDEDWLVAEREILARHNQQQSA